MSNAPTRVLKRQVSHSWNIRNDNFPWDDVRKCLHTGCRMLAEPGMVRGFAFCELHMNKAQHVLGWGKDQFFEPISEESPVWDTTT